MSVSREDRPLHLLSLDGGGVRGLSSIMILRHLMDNISKRRGRIVQPWEEFDMIGGTSTGGLIAIMLGRLRMTLDECEDAYLELSKQIFTPKRSSRNPLRAKDFLLADGKFDCKVLEKAIKDIIDKKPGFNSSDLLKDPNPLCRVFVCATQTGNSGAAIFRSYETRSPNFLFEVCKIWEACRATSAAPTFFDPIRIGKYGQRFTDGGVLYNNPIQLVEREAEETWPNRMESAVIVSIGTGSAPGGVFSGNLKNIIDAMKSIVTETEKTHNDFLLAHRLMVAQNQLYRFNVYHGLADVSLEEWRETERIANATQTYLDKGDIQQQVKACIDQVCHPGSLQGDTVEPSLVKLSNSLQEGFEQELAEYIRSLSFAGMDSRQNNVSLPFEGTCKWLFETPSFQRWKDRTDLQINNGVLWIKGNPGVGKSTLMKHMLLHCNTDFEDHNIAYYFFNARGGVPEKSPLGMLRSLMVQLLEQDRSLQQNFVPRFLRKIIRHGESEQLWERGELKDFLLLEYKQLQHRQTVLFIDALDECDEEDVQYVVDFVENLSRNAIQSGSNLRICLSSRHYPRIDIDKKIEIVVEKQPQHLHDISIYVKNKLRTTDREIRVEILTKAQGIFMWVVLVVQLLNKAYIKGQVKAMWKTLNDIPNDLDELFLKILEKKDSEDDHKMTVLIFQWMLFSRRPLGPVELYYAVLAGTNTDHLGAYDVYEIDLMTIKHFVTSSSRGLLEVVLAGKYYAPGDKTSENDIDHYNDDHVVFGDQVTVQFIHQSVIDFFTRNQRLVMLDPTLAHNAVGSTHDRLASCCMAYIMQDELNSDANHQNMSSGADSDDLGGRYPFLEYAARNLLEHAEIAQGEGISQTSLLGQLGERETFEIYRFWHDFHEVKDYHKYEEGSHIIYVASLKSYYHLLWALVHMYGADINIQGGLYNNALQAAAAEANLYIIKLLLESGADINARGGKYGFPLQAAAARGASLNIIKLLLEYGANVNAQGGKYGSTLQAAASAVDADLNVVKLLLKHGANVNAQGGTYSSPLQAAAARGASLNIIKLLIEHGAEVNDQGGYYGTPLQAAAAAGGAALDTIELLLQYGADVNAKGGYYGSPIQAAAAEADLNILKLLLKHGADVNAEGGYYSSPLQAAAAEADLDMVELLIEHGADVNIQGGRYGSALQAATAKSERYESRAIIALLLEHGAAKPKNYINSAQRENSTYSSSDTQSNLSDDE